MKTSIRHTVRISALCLAVVVCLASGIGINDASISRTANNNRFSGAIQTSVRTQVLLADDGQESHGGKGGGGKSHG